MVMSTLSLPSKTTLSKPPKNPNKINSIPLQKCLSLLQLSKHTTEFTQIHSKLVKLGLIHHTLASTKLLGQISISPFTDMRYAKSLFQSDQNPNTFAYNVMIRGYAQKNQPEKAVLMFYDLVCDCDCVPNGLTFPFVLKACSDLNAFEEGFQVHGQVLKCGLSGDLYIGNGLISLYMNLGLIDFARKVFDRMREPDVVSWNSMINGFFELGFVDEGLMMFERMPNKNVRSWNCMIDGYVKLGLLEKARRLFDQMVVKDGITWNSMINGYVSLGQLEVARELFNRMPKKMKDLITFNFMIDGYAKKYEYKYVLEIFQEMQVTEIDLNNFALVMVLTACSHVSALEQGEWIESYINKNRIEVDAILGTALVNMFAKCGQLEKAVSIFESMKEKDVEAWNSIIYNLGVHGYGKKSLSYFSEMMESNIPPDEITFLNVLSACRHAGLLVEAKKHFNLMTEKYDMKPKLEHYGCMVDLLGRAGMLNEAKDLIENFEENPSVAMWGSLLGASARLGDIEMGEYAAKHVLELDPFDAMCYVVLSNMYSAGGLYAKAVEIRKKMKENGIEKVPGCSVIEIDGVFHEFRVTSDYLE